MLSLGFPWMPLVQRQKALQVRMGTACGRLAKLLGDTVSEGWLQELAYRQASYQRREGTARRCTLAVLRAEEHRQGFYLLGTALTHPAPAPPSSGPAAMAGGGSWTFGRNAPGCWLGRPCTCCRSIGLTGALQYQCKGHLRRPRTAGTICGFGLEREKGRALKTDAMSVYVLDGIGKLIERFWEAEQRCCRFPFD